MKSTFILCFCSLLILFVNPVNAAPSNAPAAVSEQSNWLNTEAIPQILSQLRDTNLETRKPAVYQIDRLDDPAKIAIIPGLTDLLKDPNLGIRKSAAEAIYRLTMRESWQPDSQVVAKVLQTIQPLLQDSDRNTRYGAAIALGYMGKAELTSELIPELITQLKDTNPEVRSQAADVLGTMGDAAKSTVPELTPLLKDTVPSVRISMVSALGAIGVEVPGSTLLLEEVVRHDPDPAVRKAAQEALDHLYYVDHQRIRGL
ncbi:HEAT repeat domain-containing protein [Alkalinema sp. FACHB-956]|uniref:HEAT repeat domain-containing protein n=1 Tax=Alkalinema sp. FACHB-956 TaxID=2692768 RepID=UPI001689F148|nr:HEAT repeat domain-containing protein [Alkalinema sp. FACHB-956]MBD2325992.1 HEAT repeat domain-containing protein [Alkalinema sp. FACHB-956]